MRNNYYKPFVHKQVMKRLVINFCYEVSSESRKYIAIGFVQNLNLLWYIVAGRGCGQVSGGMEKLGISGYSLFKVIFAEIFQRHSEEKSVKHIFVYNKPLHRVQFSKYLLCCFANLIEPDFSSSSFFADWNLRALHKSEYGSKKLISYSIKCPPCRKICLI